MTVEALKQDLKTLSDTVPVLATRVAETQQSAQALQDAAEQLQSEIDAARASLAEQLTAVRDALPAVVVQLEAGEKQLQAGAGSVHDAWAKTEPGLDTAAGDLVDKVDALVHGNHELIGIFAAAAVKIQQSHLAGDEALARLERLAHDGEQRLHAALQGLQDHAEQYRAFTATAKQTLTESVQRLKARIASAAVTCDYMTEDALQAMHTQASAQQQSLQETLGLVSESLHIDLTESDAQLEQEITTPLATATAGAHDELERLGADAWGHEQALIRQQQALEQTVSQLDRATERVPTCIDQIQQAARAAGL